MAQGQQRGRPRRALSAGRFLAEEVPFKLRLGQFLEECWWGKPRGKGEQGGSGNLLMAQELGERTGGGGTGQDLVRRDRPPSLQEKLQFQSAGRLCAPAGQTHIHPAGPPGPAQRGVRATRGQEGHGA